MDEYSSRRTAGGLYIPRKGPSLVLRDSAENDRNNEVQVCSRIGCSSKLNPSKSAQIGSPSKAKTSKVPFHSSPRGKDIIGSSSRTLLSINTSRKSFTDHKKKSHFLVETDSETSCLPDASEEVSESTLTSGKAQMRVHSKSEDHDFFEGTSSEVGSSSAEPPNRLLKGTFQKFGLGRQDSQASSSSSSSSSSFALKQANRGERNSANASRHSLGNFRCNTASDVVPSGCSSPTESSFRRKMDIGRKRINDIESSSSARGKKIGGLILDDRRNENFGRGISISDSRRPQNLNADEDDDDSSFRTRRATARTRLLNMEDRNRLPMIESPLMSPPSSQPDMSFDAIGFSFEDQLIAQTPPSRASSFREPGSSREHSSPNRSGSPYEAGFARSFMNRETLRQFNLDGIAEMLLALERIGQEEEPSYEHLLVLETNLFLGGLSLQDQHRDMRLDIDNMSYEELLALEDRMGTVNTSVPEEALTKCLEKDIYHATTDFRGNEDDIKCSICQEEYMDKEEVGRLSCDHRYHIECINQWLRLKNWCPICKAYAAAPLPPSSIP